MHKDDMVVTKANVTDSLWPNGKISDSYVSVLCKIEDIQVKAGITIVNVDTITGECKYFQKESLSPVDSAFEEGDKVLFTRLLNVNCYNKPETTEHVLIVSGAEAPWYILAKDSTNNEYRIALGDIVKYVPKPIADRVSKDIPNRKNFLVFADYFDKLGIYEYELLGKTSKNSNVIYVQCENDKIKLICPDRTVTFDTTDNVLKSYKNYLDKKNQRWAGFVSDKQEIITVLSDWLTYWGKKWGSAVDEKKKKLQEDIADITRDLHGIKTNEKMLSDILDEWVEISEGHEIRNPNILETTTNWINQQKYFFNKQREGTEKLISYEKSLAKELEYLIKLEEGKATKIETEYENIGGLFKNEVETIGVEKGNLYIIFSPIIMQSMTYTKCPESGRTNCEVCEAGGKNAYYLGRIKLEFHGQNCPKYGKESASCYGFHATNLTYGEDAKMHPHLGHPTSCNSWCLHKYYLPLSQLVARRELTGVLMIMRQFFSTFNNHHGLTGITHFEPYIIKNGNAPTGVKDGSFDKRCFRHTYPEIFGGKKCLA